MISRSRLLASSLALAALAAPFGLLGGVAHAQVGPGTMGPTGPTGPTGEEEPKPEGIAEAAPATPGILPTTPVVPPPRSRRKKYEVFQLDGYLRLRTDWFKNFNLGFIDRDIVDGTTHYGGGAPFPRALACDSAAVGADCSDTLKSANMRLRLEPIIQLSETTKVMIQADLLDNLVLGSTPVGTDYNGGTAGGNVPFGAFSPGQDAPEAGRNSLVDGILIRRAWAEVDSPIGLLKFGRQPSHWGMGILHNAGGLDPFNGTYDLDSDYGDTADRVSFSRGIPGTDLAAGLSTDWASTAPVSSQTDLFRRGGQAFDLEDTDDISQWILSISRLDTPDAFQAKLDRGEVAFNYGFYLTYRTQDFDYRPAAAQIGQPADPNALVPRHWKTYTPDVWAHFGWGNLELEGEALTVLGSVKEVDDIDPDQTASLSIREFGGVLRLRHTSFEDKLRLVLEAGYASGDEWDNVLPGRTHISNARPLPGEGDDTINAFRFNQDYEIDLILFRELIGAVTNTTYVRPSVSYDITKSIAFKAASILSFVNVPVATPGNGSMYGIEFDGDFGYTSSAFFAGLSYGVLFPMGAMNHPAEEGFGFDDNSGDAKTAHTIQSRLVVRF